ncbi:AlkA N-terminal domain-containing protein, partial [Mycolicibacterium insubricum]|uniref:AlkA N-terminal domain-containing protein n=1 Tax=Mycolicibacterium insubricum TaxID=444597 RepID=UPI0024B34DF8
RPRQDHVACVLRLADFRDLPISVARCRRLLDLDADPIPIAETLAGDPALAAPSLPTRAAAFPGPSTT